MTLQDDIQKARRDWIRQDGIKPSIVELFAAGLERDKIIIDRADLPEVTINKYGSPRAGVTSVSQTGEPEALMELALERLALALHAKSRESEAEALEARRDELAREVGQRGPHGVNYAGSTDLYKRAIDHIIAEQDRAAAAEAEVARLKATS